MLEKMKKVFSHELKGKATGSDEEGFPYLYYCPIELFHAEKRESSALLFAFMRPKRATNKV